MRFRPASISLINRRLYLPRLLLTLSSIEKDYLHILTGHYISMSVLPTTHSVHFVYPRSLGQHGSVYGTGRFLG
jgi:hypothetical protein